MRIRIFACVVLGMLAWLNANGQDGLKEINIFGEQANTSIFIYAKSTALCPISIKLELDLNNMETVDPLADFYVVPAGAEKFKIVELRAKNIKKPIGYQSRIDEVFGDIGLKTDDKNYVYDLPFENKGSFTVFQGYNGKTSHQNEYALDFSMPEGTKILASREGIVIKTEESNTQSCPKAECAKYNNFVLVYHPDGSFAEYTHLQKNGVRVKKGDKVKKGSLIGLSGSTGWTSGPHLHFYCFLPRLGKRDSFPTKFRTGDGKTVEELKEMKTYERKY